MTVTQIYVTVRCPSVCPLIDNRRRFGLVQKHNLKYVGDRSCGFVFNLVCPSSYRRGLNKFWYQRGLCKIETYQCIVLTM